MNGAFDAEGLMLSEQLSHAEVSLLMARLRDLLAMQTGKYTSCDSTSVTVETAQELLASLWYTLTVAMDGLGIPCKRLLTDELWPLIEEGRKLLFAKFERTKRLWETVCMTAPDIQNFYYISTMRGIGAYFKQYDVYYFAHRLPANIDYPLILSPSKTLQGISYTEVYLKHILAENRILRCFDTGAVRRVLKQVTSDYEDFFLNLCEQPMTNALALTVLEKPVRSLLVTDNDMRQLVQMLGGMDKAALQTKLYAAVDALKFDFGVIDDFTRHYLHGMIDGLLPRLENVLTTGNISAVFV